MGPAAADPVLWIGSSGSSGVGVGLSRKRCFPPLQRKQAQGGLFSFPTPELLALEPAHDGIGKAPLLLTWLPSRATQPVNSKPRNLLSESWGQVAAWLWCQ